MRQSQYCRPNDSRQRKRPSAKGPDNGQSKPKGAGRMPRKPGFIPWKTHTNWL